MTLAPITPELWTSLWLTVRLAGISTLILLAVGVPLAGWLNRPASRLAPLVEALVSLPIVLPPTVIGFYVLLLVGSHSPVGRGWMAVFGTSLAFSFPGLVVGSVIYSLPYAVQPIQSALRDIDSSLIEAACALGAGARQVFWRIMVPAARNGIVTGAALSFAHTMGEFGVVLMLGGNIPGVTRVASIALYDETQTLNYGVAHSYALVLLLCSFAMLLLIGRLRQPMPTWSRPRQGNTPTAGR
ncbi:MAG: molybdate ABC transporter permease subunit [Nevskia sp.]|nr:molybdate ABC transporter permease subunit [Nevskia sp.]